MQFKGPRRFADSRNRPGSAPGTSSDIFGPSGREGKTGDDSEPSRGIAVADGARQILDDRREIRQEEVVTIHRREFLAKATALLACGVALPSVREGGTR